MNRRKFLIRTVQGSTVAASAISAPAIAQSEPTIKWRMVTSFPKSLDILSGAANQVAKRVATITDNKFQIQTFSAGEIVPPLQVLDAVQNGTVEAGLTPSFFYIGKDPTFAFDTAIPFGLTTRQQAAWVLEGGGYDLMKKFYQKYNVVHFPAANTGAQMGGWFRKEIKTVDDLHGIKMRVVGLGAQILAKLGVVPQNIPPGDLYPALEKGTIDAAEWIGPVDDERLGFVKVAKYYYYPGWWDPCAQTNVYVNQQHWDKLPDAYKAAIATACSEAYTTTVAAYDARSPIALRRLITQGAILKPFSQELLTICEKTAFEHYEEIAQKNADFRAIYEPWKKFRSEIILWFSVAENSLDSFIMRAEAQRRG